MQFTIPRDTILPVLGALSRTARPNGPLPQLGFAQVCRTRNAERGARNGTP